MVTPENTQPLESEHLELIISVIDGMAVLYGQRGSLQERIGTLNFDPKLPREEHFFTNDAQDLFCFVDAGNGYERKNYGETVYLKDILSIGYGRGKVEQVFDFVDNIKDDQS
ncbi:MAG: hypothetical protein IH934_03345 [Nanoarchaeota archaeon]|nr:hypothetical protein [Nanoarchaeota archaeon]